MTNGNSEATESMAENPQTIAVFHLNVTTEHLIYAGVVLTIDLVLVMTNLLMIIIITASESLRDVINYYMVSLSAADLIIGILMCPLGFYAALDERWKFDDNGSPLCKSISYLGIAIVSKKIYMYVWIAVDRYAMINKPTRYDAEQTMTRCKCWILFTWSTAVLLCCPTLFTEMSQYYDYAKLCLIDWGTMPAYSATLAVLVLLPSLCCIVYSYFYIFRKFLSIDRQQQEVRVVLENDNTILTIFTAMIVFILSWLPWIALRTYEAVRVVRHISIPLHFGLLWLGISGGSWKLFIFLAMNPDFRSAAAELCGCACRRKQSQYNMINGVNRYREGATL